MEIGAESAPSPCSAGTGETSATGQFEIADERSPAEIAEYLRSIGLEPVWKDWDTAILAPAVAFR